MDGERHLAFAALLHAALALFHLALPALFRWPHELPRLSPHNAAILYILNNHVTLALAGLAYVLFVHVDELLALPLGHALLLLESLWWAARAAQQIVYFGLATAWSRALFGVFASMCVATALPWCEATNAIALPLVVASHGLDLALFLTLAQGAWALVPTPPRKAAKQA